MSLSRRSLVASAAALPLITAPITSAVSAAVISAEETFARIERHRATTLKIKEVCDRMGQLEAAIPKDRQLNYHIYDRGTDVGANDDPRWTAIQGEYWAAADEWDEIAWLFVDRPPTSGAGVAALLAYAAEHEAAGYEWPDCRHHISENGQYLGFTEEDWRSSLMAAIIPALAKLA
jgi:hypothetical protein